MTIYIQYISFSQAGAPLNPRQSNTHQGCNWSMPPNLARGHPLSRIKFLNQPGNFQSQSNLGVWDAQNKKNNNKKSLSPWGLQKTEWGKQGWFDRESREQKWQCALAWNYRSATPTSQRFHAPRWDSSPHPSRMVKNGLNGIISRGKVAFCPACQSWWR